MAEGSWDLECQNWASDVLSRLEDVPTVPAKHSIYRVPIRLQADSSDAFIPQVVSIGPLHSEMKNLGVLEDHKWYYMSCLLKRIPERKSVEAEFVRRMLDLEGPARDLYASSISFTKVRHAQIILLDGCFILELFLRWRLRSSNAADPIFDIPWMLPAIRRDLMLLENQIPFIALEELFKLTFGNHVSQDSSLSLTELALSFFKEEFNLEVKITEEVPRSSSLQVSHLLDLIHRYYILLPVTAQIMGGTDADPSNEYNRPNSTKKVTLNHSASNLAGVGIPFRKAAERNLLDIRFDKGGFEIPPLDIHETMDTLLRNLVAFEQCTPNISQHITSYVVLMDRLVESPKDVRLLRSKGIIKNYLGSGEDVLQLFGSISKHVVLEENYYAELCDEVNRHYNMASNRCRAKMRRRCCGTRPWVTATVLVAIVLFLEILQTFVPIFG